MKLTFIRHYEYFYTKHHFAPSFLLIFIFIFCYSFLFDLIAFSILWSCCTPFDAISPFSVYFFFFHFSFSWVSALSSSLVWLLFQLLWFSSHCVILRLISVLLWRQTNHCCALFSIFNEQSLICACAQKKI